MYCNKKRVREFLGSLCIQSKSRVSQTIELTTNSLLSFFFLYYVALFTQHITVVAVACKRTQIKVYSLTYEKANNCNLFVINHLFRKYL